MWGWNSRRTAAAVLTLVVAVGLTACSDDDKKEATGAGATTTAAPTGSPSVSVTMTEYAYSVSGPLTAGGTIKLANTGQQFHMMGFGKLKPGKTLADVEALLQQMGQSEGGPGGESSTSEGQTSTTGGRTSTTAAASSTTQAGSTTLPGGGEEQDPFAAVAEDVGVPAGVMGPGQSADITVPDFGAGTYAMICFIPTEGEGTPHAAKGMVNQLTVVPGTAPPAPTADATYKIAAGKAIEGPTTLTAGTHTLKFEATGPGIDQLEPGLAKLNAGTTMQQLVETADKIFGEGENSPPPPPGVASQLPGQLVYGGFDLRQATTFYVSANFTTGKYAIDAADTDPRPRPKPDKEVIEITVR